MRTPKATEKQNMAQHTLQPQHLLLLSFLLILGLAANPTESQSRPGCDDTCGSLSIPYPFGTSQGCYLDDSFLITCKKTTNPPTPLLRQGNITVLNISLDGEMRISSHVARDCYNKTGTRVNRMESSLKLSRFSVSNTKNKFTVLGCDTLAIIMGSDGINYTTGCLSLCDSLRSVVNGSCSGIGCCQTSIPQGLTSYVLSTGSLNNHTRVGDFNPCGYAFVTEEGDYDFSSSDLLSYEGTTAPVVLDWAVGNVTCQIAREDSESFACKAQNSECYEAENVIGYRCNCSSGFQGNPYLENGCQDIDECLSNPCSGTCLNVPGSFECSCPEGYEGDGTREGTGCQATGMTNNRRVLILIIALSVSVSLLALIVGSFYVYWWMKKRKLIKIKEKFFQQNGGILLQQQIASYRGSMETAKIFTAEELKKATNNFDESRVLGQGGYGTVYKGVLQDNKVVAIKKSKICDQSQIEQFVNEVLVLTQINHRNVVKLLGCCLETEVPLLVYEFITNGTLSDHIHDESQVPSLSWATRLRIAAETAGALAYLHSATSTPVIHRDVKTSNILLDENYNAKVSDFGASRLVPLDQTQLTTLVQGTLGYLDPEYFHSSQLTEKSDVYSFGVVLAELLTSMKALSFDRPEGDRNLAMFFVSSMKGEEGRLLKILDKNMVNKDNVKQLEDVANLAKRCLKVKGEERPTMKEVAMELEGLRITEKHPWGKTDFPSEETQYLLTPNYIVNVEDGVGQSGTASGFDSMRNQIIKPWDSGR